MTLKTYEYKPSNPKDNLKRVITSFSKFRIDKESEVQEKDVKEWECRMKQ